MSRHGGLDEGGRDGGSVEGFDVVSVARADWFDELDELDEVWSSDGVCGADRVLLGISSSCQMKSSPSQ